MSNPTPNFASPSAPDDCRYECPYTEDGHAAMDIDHEYVR